MLWLQGTILAASFFLAGLAVGVAAESINGFQHDRSPLGFARLRLHTVRRWKAAGEALAVALGGVVCAFTRSIGAGTIAIVVGICLSLLIAERFLSDAERRVRALEADAHRPSEQRR